MNQEDLSQIQICSSLLICSWCKRFRICWKTKSKGRLHRKEKFLRSAFIQMNIHNLMVLSSTLRPKSKVRVEENLMQFLLVSKLFWGLFTQTNNFRFQSIALNLLYHVVLSLYGGCSSDNFVSTQLQLWLFCCWGCGCCRAVTTKQ